MMELLLGYLLGRRSRPRPHSAPRPISSDYYTWDSVLGTVLFVIILLALCWASTLLY